ncbi:hypothetical protein Belba_0599 [Belliella baltica DSM 15883]|uniref:Glycine-rich domain-containing protein n=1 Tax=Belliella baltica (strain DSM 15883 / CIP 108006 / LMG 21964 / BA134) TaxID=866536 RepID=I3Z1Y8_BELBD|nr:hypothetical protein [Belliella baltica]AFL83256.1 hypothetical protein Belba_0599 [Belliella baltica DSM 15883]
MNIKFYLSFIVGIFVFLVFSGEVLGQTFTSNQNGNWNTAGIWTRSNPFGCGALRNAPPSTSDYAAACRVDVNINHEVFYNQPNVEFGSGYFRTLNVNGINGKLTFQENVTFNTAGSSLPAPNNVIFNVNNGGELNVPNGTLSVNRGGVINITGNSTVIVRDLILVSNNATINVEEGSKLIILNTTTINSNTTLNVNGEFLTRDLIFGSGGNLNAMNNSFVRVSNNVNLSNGLFNASGNTDIRVANNFLQSGGGSYNGSGNSYIQVNGNHNVSSNNPVNLSNTSKFYVVGERTGSMGGNIGSQACYRTNSINPSGCSQNCTVTQSINDGEAVIITYFCDGTWTPPQGLSEYQVLIVGGGGAGGRTNSGNSNKAGGGGGGGAVVFQTVSIPSGIPAGQSYNITIGAGGNGASTVPAQRNGQQSTFNNGNNFIAGGGGGGGLSNVQNGLSGINNSSGGGAGAQGNNQSGNGASGNGNGNLGGNSSSSGNSDNQYGGGGGGANAAGVNGDGNRNGGSGIMNPISGIETDYAAGGGGGAGGNNNSGNGGIGGGGNGGNANNTAQNGAVNTGSGGGGAGGNNRSGGNGGSGIVIIRYEIFRILPVELLEFNASFTPQNRTSTISWATGKEWENSHFEIERAIDNVKSFEKIGEVEGVGYSDDVEEYSFIDEKLPLLGGMAYYRLKQVDFSGSFSYSDVVGVRIPPMNITKGVWRAFPNPTSGESFNLELINNREYNNEELSIRLVTSLANHKPVEGKDLKEISHKIADLLRKSPHGVYILEVNWGQKIEYIKILKK